MSRFAFGLITVLITSSALAAPQYEVTNLTEAFYANYDGSVAIEDLEINCMNNVGQFAGTCTNSDNIQDAFLWQPGSAPVWLGLNKNVDSRYIYVYSMNDSGQVIGGSYSSSVGTRYDAFCWNQGSGIQRLNETLSFSVGSIIAYGINANGDVIFSAAAEDGGGVRAFQWNDTTGLTEIGTNVSGLKRAIPYAINDYGQMVCHFSGEDEEHEFWGNFFLDPTQDMVEMEGVPQSVTGMNNSGQVLLFGLEELEVAADDFYTSSFGLVWQDGQFLQLNDPEEWDILWTDINNKGEVVGYSWGMEEEVGTGRTERGVVYWSQETGMVSLIDTFAPAGIASSAPMDFNDVGEILLTNSGDYWFASPVPEPGMSILLLSSVGVFLLSYIKRFPG